MLNHQINWSLRDVDVDFIDLLDFKESLGSVKLCPIFTVNSPLLKHLHEYAYDLSLKYPQFCSLGTYCFGGDHGDSLYLLQVINPSFS